MEISSIGVGGLTGRPAVSSLPGPSGLGTESAGIGAASPTPAAQSDVSAFQRLLGRQPVQGTAPINSIAKSAPADLLAQGIREAASAYQSRFESLKQGLQRVEKQQSIASLLEYQLESAKMGVEMEMTGKIVSKVVQDVEQLTKQQG